MDLAALERYCRMNMPTYMTPHKIHQWPGRMPRTDTGKLDKVRVRAVCEGDEAQRG